MVRRRATRAVRPVAIMVSVVANGSGMARV
jgi:hypothetical protein